MNNEEIREVIIESLRNGTLQPANIILGDSVQHKIEKVEAGGIGVQENHYHNTTCTSKTTTRLKALTSTYTQNTFRYRHLKSCSNRLTMLFQRLQTTAKWIDASTNPDDFHALFTGEPSDTKIKWTGKQAYLYYLIRQIVERGLVTIPEGATIWQITESHFIDKNSRHFHDFNKQKEPIKAKKAIDKLVDIIDPSVTEED